MHTINTTFVKDDGGRAEAGYKGTTGDCTVRAIAIATEQPYKKVYDDLFELNRVNNPKSKRTASIEASPRNGGTTTKTIREYMESLGWEWIATMRIGSGCRVHVKPDELPSGRLVLRLSKHMSAMVDGVVHDTFDPSREGTRAVYGYYHKP